MEPVVDPPNAAASEVGEASIGQVHNGPAPQQDEPELSVDEPMMEDIKDMQDQG